MSQAEFEIKISPQGKVSLEVKGAQGPECMDLTRFLEQSLGEVQERKLKSEYYNASINTSVQNQQY